MPDDFYQDSADEWRGPDRSRDDRYDDGYRDHDERDGLTNRPPARSQRPRPSRGQSILKLFLLAGGSMLLLCCLTCGGCTWLGVSSLERTAIAEYGNRPEVIDAIGPVIEADYLLQATGEAAQEGNEFDLYVRIFELTGEKGTARLRVRQSENPPPFYGDGYLELDDGTTIPLDGQDEENPFNLDALQKRLQELLEEQQQLNQDAGGMGDEADDDGPEV